jgi:hypothetical protein
MVPRLDLLRRQLRVEQQLITGQGRAPFLAPPKTAASVRQVPLPGTVVDTLAAHLAEFEPGELGTVFSGEGGEPLRRNRFSERVWRPAVAAAHLRPGTRFHELRHYYASLLIRHGESVKTVQARLGHASAGETLDAYAYLWPDSEDRTREAVDSALGLAAVWGGGVGIKALVRALMTVSRPVGGEQLEKAGAWHLSWTFALRVRPQVLRWSSAHRASTVTSPAT